MTAHFVTVDDDDRDDNPGDPWTVSCRKCQEGINFWPTDVEAWQAATNHVAAHAAGRYDEEET